MAKTKAVTPEEPNEETHLILANGERGPRIAVYEAMIERMYEYYDEVERGERIPNYILEQQRFDALSKPKQKRATKRVTPKETL